MVNSSTRQGWSACVEVIKLTQRGVYGGTEISLVSLKSQEIRLWSNTTVKVTQLSNTFGEEEDKLTRTGLWGNFGVVSDDSDIY